MKRKLTRLLVTLLIALNVMGASIAFATEAKEITAPNITAVDKSGEVSTRAEETAWAYREYNGWYQKRLWSYTYGKWLTEWINTFPVQH